jgi:hypothetical protein
VHPTVHQSYCVTLIIIQLSRGSVQCRQEVGRDLLTTFSILLHTTYTTTDPHPLLFVSCSISWCFYDKKNHGVPTAIGGPTYRARLGGCPTSPQASTTPTPSQAGNCSSDERRLKTTRCSFHVTSKSVSYKIQQYLQSSVR